MTENCTSNSEVVDIKSTITETNATEDVSAPKMTVAECQVETQKHIESVRKYIRFLIDKIDMRGVKHDASKLDSPEVELFAANRSHCSYQQGRFR